MAAEYEYVAVELPKVNSETMDRDITVELNKVAEHGWRLAGLLPREGLIRPFAVFERKVGSNDAAA